MRQAKSEIIPKTLEKILFLHRRLTIQDRDELHPVFDSIGSKAPGAIVGPPFAVFHWDTGVEGIEVEAGFPISTPIEASDATARTLEEVEAFTLVHVGPYEELRQSYSLLYTQLYARGIPASLISREVFQKHDARNPERNVTEVQVLVHDWNTRLAEAVEGLLGAQARMHVMAGSELLGFESTGEDRTCWVRKAVARLDKLADDDQKYDILSRCAHVFPEERIEKLRSIYQLNGELADVLGEMKKDPEWYESPTVEGTCIRVVKVPCNRQAYDTAPNTKDRRNAYCHCPMVRDCFEETPPSFCYCGSGWYRRLWEGILGRPVRVRIDKSLTKGDDRCEFTIET
jgi:hypothetical protein